MGLREVSQGAKLRRVRIGKEVRRLRLARGLSVVDVAGRLGVWPSYVHNVESGRSSLARVAEMARVLGVSTKRLEAAGGTCPACKGTGVV
jgi:transcriptional regulator with XRE-family HTH domain